MDDSIELILGRNSSPQSQNHGPVEVAALNESRHKALERIDNARFSYVNTLSVVSPSDPLLSSWNHAKICFVAGLGFFIDAQVHQPFS